MGVENPHIIVRGNPPYIISGQNEIATIEDFARIPAPFTENQRAGLMSTFTQLIGDWQRPFSVTAGGINLSNAYEIIKATLSEHDKDILHHVGVADIKTTPRAHVNIEQVLRDHKVHNRPRIFLTEPSLWTHVNVQALNRIGYIEGTQIPLTIPHTTGPGFLGALAEYYKLVITQNNVSYPIVAAKTAVFVVIRELAKG